jgi:hypothetical protein
MNAAVPDIVSALRGSGVIRVSWFEAFMGIRWCGSSLTEISMAAGLTRCDRCSLMPLFALGRVGWLRGTAALADRYRAVSGSEK